MFKGHQGAVTDVAFDQNGATILSLSEDLTLREWDLESGAELRRHNFGAVPNSLVLSPNGRTAFVSVKIDLREWIVEDWQERARLIGHSADVNVGAEIAAIAVDPLGRVVVTAGSDRTVRVWNVAGQVGQRRFDTGGVGMEAIAVSSDGRQLVAGMGTGGDGRVGCCRRRRDDPYGRGRHPRGP